MGKHYEDLLFREYCQCAVGSPEERRAFHRWLSFVILHHGGWL